MMDYFKNFAVLSESFMCPFLYDMHFVFSRAVNLLALLGVRNQKLAF